MPQKLLDRHARNSALESGVILQTLRRYLKQYAGVTPTQLEPVAIPALVVQLERQVVEAVR